jgi:2-hydroxy-6-oxonona-2,4-dienedioate hydrolase
MEISLTSGETETVWTVVAGTRMHARVSGTPGDGPAVILVHGLVVSARYMIPAMKRLALRHRVYAPDLPGFGNSGKPARVPGVPGLTDALDCWMRKLGLERTKLANFASYALRRIEWYVRKMAHSGTHIIAPSQG